MHRGGVAPSAGFSFSTPTAYCLAALGGNCSDNFITEFSIFNTSLANKYQIPPCEDGRGGAVPSQAYTYYTPTRPTNTTTLLAGATYQVAVMVSGNSNVSAWLDANQNGEFEESEWTQIALFTQNGLPSVASLTVPTTALSGLTGLRIRTRTSGSPNGAFSACANFLSGEVEDYTVTIARPTAAMSLADAIPVAAYPNPATTTITVPLHLPASNSGARLVLYDLAGRAVLAQPVAAGTATATLGVGGLATGLYLLALEVTGQPANIQRLMVTR